MNTCITIEEMYCIESAWKLEIKYITLRTALQHRHRNAPDTVVQQVQYKRFNLHIAPSTPYWLPEQPSRPPCSVSLRLWPVGRLDSAPKVKLGWTGERYEFAMQVTICLVRHHVSEHIRDRKRNILPFRISKQIRPSLSRIWNDIDDICSSVIRGRRSSPMFGW